MYGSGYTTMRPVTRGVKWLLLANIAVFILGFLLVPSAAFDPMQKNWVVELFGLNRQAVMHGNIWQPFTYMFLHGGFFHLFANMLGLYFLGPEVELALGTRRFVRFYLVCGVLVGLAWMIFSGNGVCIGASGAVYGVVAAFAGLYPRRRLTMLVYFVLPINMTASTLMLILVGGSLFMAIFGGGHVAHVAHLAGAVAGYLYGSFLRGSYGGFDPVRARRRSGNQLSSLRAWYLRRQFKIMNNHSEPLNWMEVDAVLDKIRHHGVGSLTPAEKELLDSASREKRL